MIRIIVRTDCAGMACNVGGAVETSYRTFDVDLPDLEQFLREDQGTYSQRQALGIELIDPTK